MRNDSESKNQKIGRGKYMQKETEKMWNAVKVHLGTEGLKAVRRSFPGLKKEIEPLLKTSRRRDDVASPPGMPRP